MEKKVISKNAYTALKMKYDKLKVEHEEMVNGINEVFDRYYEGRNDDSYDPTYSANDALDDIEAWL